VNSGGTVSGGTVSSGGVLYVSGGGAEGVIVSDGGIFGAAATYPNYVQLSGSSTGNLIQMGTNGPIDAALTHGKSRSYLEYCGRAGRATCTAASVKGFG
jgi:autotransporter passenger strand-loop-strand repeat protein